VFRKINSWLHHELVVSCHRRCSRGTADIHLYRSYAHSSCTRTPVSPVTPTHAVTADTVPAAIPSRGVHRLTLCVLLCRSLCLFDVRLSHLNKDYLLRTVIIEIDNNEAKKRQLYTKLAKILPRYRMPTL